ncbi:hypothetical protein BDZ91DRAFT_759966 [Kalaharituber pfeilii]|nr:hypothetical protein BDZ91DRAFT_759966 [Kalaharituber pfeilii]
MAQPNPICKSLITNAQDNPTGSWRKEIWVSLNGRCQQFFSFTVGIQAHMGIWAIAWTWYSLMQKSQKIQNPLQHVVLLINYGKQHPGRKLMKCGAAEALELCEAPAKASPPRLKLYNFNLKYLSSHDSYSKVEDIMRIPEAQITNFWVWSRKLGLTRKVFWHSRAYKGRHPGFSARGKLYSLWPMVFNTIFALPKRTARHMMVYQNNAFSSNLHKRKLVQGGLLSCMSHDLDTKQGSWKFRNERKKEASRLQMNVFGVSEVQNIATMHSAGNKGLPKAQSLKPIASSIRRLLKHRRKCQLLWGKRDAYHIWVTWKPWVAVTIYPNGCSRAPVTVQWKADSASN